MGFRGLKRFTACACALSALMFTPLAASPRKGPQEIKISARIRKPVKLAIVGLYGHRPTDVVVSMVPRFVEYVKARHGYEASVWIDAATFASCFDEVSKIMKNDPRKLNLLLIDSQLLGTFAESGLILQVNGLIERYPELDPELYDPVTRKYYQEYPDGSGRLWGFPCAGNTIGLFVRKDLFEDPEERNPFKKKYGFSLPKSFEDWEKIGMPDFEKIAEFFTRPDRNMWGTSMQYSKSHDFISISFYPFMFSLGGEIWESGERRVWGVLNSEVNADAIAWNVRMLKYQPPLALGFNTQHTIFYFYNLRSLATSFAWTEHGVYMIGKELEGKVDVVPPPSFRRPEGSTRRIYPVGGQPWVINRLNDPDHMRVTVDFLKWWYLPETQYEYAKEGGIPVDKTTLSTPGFDDMHPWHRAYKYMHTAERAVDFWHDPFYCDMLPVQQEGFRSYASGMVDDAKRVLDWIACRQQKILFEGGRSAVPPPAGCGSEDLGR